MKSRACPRVWEVEAARDLRISGEALASHRRHRAECTECEREHGLLEAMAAQLGAHEPMDEVALRRMRSSLLQAAHAGATERRPRAARWALMAAATLVVAVLSVVVVTRPHPPAPPPETVVVATALGNAQWSRTDTPTGQEIDLRDGTLELAVQRPPSGAPLVVRVPDGEIEDLGTRFQVAVREQKTQAITVTEGAVVFRRAGEADVRVEAGQSWAREQPRAAVQAPRGLQHEEVNRPPAQGAARAAPAPSASSAGKDGAPSDLAEDAAYLHVVALLREGRTAEARLAAQDYLRSFPEGFRRVEMERVAR